MSHETTNGFDKEAFKIRLKLLVMLLVETNPFLHAEIGCKP